jgi:hypothetical protein
MSTGVFYGARYRSLGPDEVAFTAQTFNGPCLVGRLVLNREEAALSMYARPYWSVYAVFFIGFWCAGFPWQVLAFISAMFAINLWWEVRTFRRVFEAVCVAIDGPRSTLPA